jgi:tripartite ATP-independent transporter DctM subunit
MSSQLIGFICVAGMLGMIALRMPIALGMAVAGFVGFGWIVAFDPAISILESGAFETISNYDFSPIPMFIFMGVLASKARMSAELFHGAKTLFGAWRGGMALAAVTSCGIFSAISGSSLATAASMSKVALPEMKKNGYADSLATGTLAAGGTLGIMIPPSIALLLYGLLTEQSVGDMFIAGIIPGFMGLLLYMAAIAITVKIFPHLATPGEATTLRQKLSGLKGLVPFAGIFTLIIGGIYGGIFTPTEAASVGAFGALIIALYRGMNWKDFIDAVAETLVVSTMIFFMVIGAEIFSVFLSVSQVSNSLVNTVTALNLSPFMILLCILSLYIVLGMVMDSIAMLLLTVPVVYPLAMAAGFDPIWFGIVTVITVELGLITPPIGMNVFVINSVAKDDRITSIFKGVIPFVISDIVRLALIITFPFLALGLL